MGKRPNPKQPPPYATDKGLWGQPTLMQNVETLACIPHIVQNGAQWFKELALTDNAAGTKIFCVSGNVNRPGCYELPLGIQLSEIIETHCGGMKDGARFKACLPGGASTGYLTAEHYDIEMKMTCFMVMIKVAGDGRNLQIAELAGLHRRSPLLAMALMMALFGLAGIPPTIGFAGKLLIFKAAIEQGYLVLVIIAMINVVISLYYYLRVLKAAYLDPADTQTPAVALSLSGKMLAMLMVVLIVAMGFYPTGLLKLVYAATLGIIS
jgi:hypothetical protein